MLSIRRPGFLTSLQDAGRHGSAHLGIGSAGAADAPALALANALVGNQADACGLEITLDGPTLQTDAAAWIALTGAPLPHAQVDDSPLPMWRPVFLRAGACVRLGPMAQGCRSYLAITGGITVPAWRGSASTDLNAALGPVPRALEAGDQLPIGAAIVNATAPVPWSLDPRPWFDASRIRHLRLLPARHSSQLDAASRQHIIDAEFHVDPASNRVGVRLAGPPLTLKVPLELVSEGSVAGTVQLPPHGQPIILGPEHPVTGGYPRIAQVAAVDLPVLAQSRPGDTVRFAWIDADSALTRLLAREAAIEQLVQTIRRRRESS